ncbi:MAG: methyltransferase domain-containing protein [Pseudomonadota bacterium]
MSSYHQRYIDKLKTLTDIRNKDVAVFGCSFGLECGLFIDENANSVVGFDVTDKIGTEFTHPNVRYERRSVADTGESDNAFDIVYSCAVFEHVQDLKGGFREAVRVCKPGGTIMILSSPIWYAPYGNHMIARIEQLPWCHLLYSPRALRDLILNTVPGFIDRSDELDQMIDTIFDPVYFNRLPAQAYLDAVESLEGVQIKQNVLWPAAVRDEYKEKYFEKCRSMGFQEQDLLSGAHFFHGVKDE